MSSICAFPQTRWEEYSLQPLSLIYPEEQALSNPPFIHWQGVRDAALYEIALKSKGAVHIWSTERNFYTPEKALALGLWTVEISALDKSGRRLGISQARGFRVTKAAPRLELRMNKIAPAKGKPFFFPPRTMKAIKAATGERGDYRDRLLDSARQTVPSRLKDFREPLRYKEGAWDFDTWKQNNSLCFAIEDYVLQQAFAFLLTGEKRFFDNARRIMLKVAEWDSTGATGVWENDHSAQALLHALAVGYNVLGAELAAQEKQKIVRAITQRAEDMYGFLNPFIAKNTSSGPMNDPDNNHPWFCASALGLGGLALMGETPEAEAWVAFTAQLFHGVFLPRGGSTGAWHEGIDYWSYMLFFVFQFCDALETAAGIDLYQHPWLQHTAFFKIYCHPPQGGYVPFGDSKDHPPNAFDKLVMMRLASKYDDPLAWRYVDGIPETIGNNRLFHALLWCDRTGAKTRNATQIPFARNFDDIGWVVSNNSVFDGSKQILFAFRSGKSLGRKFNHSHADQNSFIITAGGDKLLWDAGYYDSYLSPHHRNYSRLSIAHNTILVDGEGQAVHTKGADGKITRFETRGKSLIVQGDASNPRIYGDKVDLFLRTIEYSDEKHFLIRDEIRLRERGQVSWLLHSVYPIIYDAEKKSILIKGEHYQLSGVFETPVLVEAIINTKFPVTPDLPSHVLDAKNIYPEQYHLELRTREKIETWNPSLTLTLSPIRD
jgi:hypothetical protein